MAFQPFWNIHSADNFPNRLFAFKVALNFLQDPQHVRGHGVWCLLVLTSSPGAPLVEARCPLCSGPVATRSVSRSSPTKRNGAWGRVSSCSVVLRACSLKLLLQREFFFIFLSFLTTQAGLVCCYVLTSTLVNCAGKVSFNLKGTLYVAKRLYTNNHRFFKREKHLLRRPTRFRSWSVPHQSDNIYLHRSRSRQYS